MQISDILDIEIDKDVVRRVLGKYYKPFGGGDGPSWLTFMGHTMDSLHRDAKPWILSYGCCAV